MPAGRSMKGWGSVLCCFAHTPVHHHLLRSRGRVPSFPGAGAPPGDECASLVSMTPPAPPPPVHVKYQSVPRRATHSQVTSKRKSTPSDRDQKVPEPSTPGDASCTRRQAALVCLSSAAGSSSAPHCDMGTQCLRGNGPNLCSFKSLPSLLNERSSPGECCTLSHSIPFRVAPRP